MGKQWSPPASDAPVQSNGWTPPASDVELKKKASDTPTSASPFSSPQSTQAFLDGQDASNPTRKPSVNGVNTFLSGQQQNTDLTPVLPENRADVRQTQIAQQQQEDARSKAVSDNYKKIRSELSPEAQANWDKALDYATKRQPDQLRAVTQEEQDHYNFMQTPIGKTLGAVAYLGSKATKGTLQVAKGAAYLMDMTNPANVMMGGNPSTNMAFDKLDEKANFGLTKGDQQRIGENPVMQNLGGLTEYLPAAAAAAGTGGATLYLQGIGQGKDAMDEIEKQGVKVNPVVKAAFILGTGAVNGYLMGDLGNSMFKSLPAGLRGDITASITADAIKEAAGKDITAQGFKDLLDNGAKTFGDKLAKGGIATLDSYNHAVKNLGSLAIGNFALKKGVDLTNDQTVFNENLGNLASNLQDVATKQAPFFAIPGAIGAATKLTPYSEYKNSVVENLMHDSSPENIEKTKQDIANYGQQQQWTPEETQATIDHVDKLAAITKVLPKNLPESKMVDAVNLVQGRNDLQERLAKEQEQRKQLDPAVQGVISPNEQLLTDKVEQANDKLRALATGKQVYYGKDHDEKTGEENGKFYKLFDGKKEEISESRYNLERLERDSKIENNEQTKSNKEVPAEQPADETASVPKVADQNDEAVENKPIVQPKVRIPQPEFKDIRESAKENHGKETAETLAQEANTKKWYHGSGRDLSKEDINSAVYSKPDGLLGLGFYMTDNPEIAEKYSNLRRNRSGSTVNEFDLKTSKLLDAEKPIDADVSKLYKRVFRSLFFDEDEANNFFDDVKKQNPNASMMDYHKAIYNHIADEQIPTNEVHENFQDLEASLKDDLGYDGISHIGGKVTNGKNHNVIIALDPSGDYSERRNLFTKVGKYEPKYDETTKNSPIKSTENEKSTKKHEEGSANEEKSSKGGDAKSKIGNEKNDAEKGNVTPTGEAETSPVTKEARQKAIDAVTHGVVYHPNEKNDGYSARFDFGMTKVEKDKAFSDINKGKYETAPAKKMLAKIQEWEKNDNYPVIEGAGGHSEMQRGATSNEIQQHIDDEKANKANEFTKSEIKEINSQWADRGVTYEDLKAHRDYEQQQERNSSGDNGKKVAANEKTVQQPENDGNGNVGKDRPGEEPERPKSSTGKTTFKKPPLKISEQAKTLAEKIRSLKSDKNSLHGGLQGVVVAIYDGALETAATVIEKGGKLIDAIDAAVKYIVSNSEEKDEDKIRGAITKDLEGLDSEPEKTGIRHADTEKERAESGTVSDVAKKDRRRETIDAKGKELVDDDPDYANRTAKDIIDKERPATDVEQAALEYRKTQLKNQRRKILKDTDPENASDNEIKLAKITDEITLNQKATDIGGSELGSGLGYRTQLMNEDYSTETVIGRAKVANGGEELDPRDKAELEKRAKRIEELENQRDDLVEKLKKQSENSLVDKVNRTANHEERQAKREVTKASLRKEREGLLADLHLLAKKARSSAGANKISVDMIVPLTKLARNYVLDGATSLASVVDKLYNDLKDHIDGLDKEDIANVVKENFDKYLTEQNELRLGRAKKLQQTKLEKLKSGTFEQKAYAKILVDNDYLNIRAEINREQQRVNKKIADIENSKKSLNRKIVDVAVKYGRQAKLASVTVLGKLASTGLATIGIKPIQEGIGKGLSAILPKVAKKSSVEGSVSRSAMREANKLTDGAAVKSISQAYSRAFTIGMKDAYQELTGAGSNLTNLYKERGATLPSEAREFFGHLHSAIKAPVKRFAWELSYAKRTAKMIDAGLDPLDPVNDAQNRLNAYKDGEKAIFMGDNTLSKIYENNVGSLEKSQSSINRTAGAAFRILLPFVKVPSNIVLEGAKYSFGSVSGIARLGRAMTKGMDNLSPEEADIILEHLKKGSIGGAALALGFFNPNAFGGFYQPGKKEKIAPGHIKVGDVNIPAFAVEHPVFIAAQVGANFRQLLDKYRHKDDRIPVAALATISGLGYEVPQANEIKRLVDLTGDIRSMAKWEKFGAETLKGEIEPAALQQLAEITDVKEGAKTTIPGLSFTDHTQQKRAPKLQRKGFMKYVGQTLETGIPGLRKNVPKKH